MDNEWDWARRAPDPDEQLGEWTWRDSPDYHDKQREWKRRDGLDLNDIQRDWRKKETPDDYAKQKEWKWKGLPNFSHKQKQWKSNEPLDLLEKGKDWRRKDAFNQFEQERDWRRKDSSNCSERQRTRWRQIDSLEFSGNDPPEKRTDARHAKRACPNFQGSDERERWAYDLRKEEALNSMSCLELNPAGSVRVSLKRSLQEFDSTQCDKEHTGQWQLREQRGPQRESLELKHLSKAIESDTRPVLEPSEYNKGHPRQTVRMQAQDACMPSHLHGPTRHCLVQDRRAFPSSQVLWTGCFNVMPKKSWSTSYKGIQAHPSTSADPKVCEAMLALPFELQLEEIERGEGSDLWPRIFQECPPTSQSIGIFFAPKDVESDHAWYQPLVHRLNACGFVLKSEMDFVQLLIYPSQLLPEAEQRWDGRFFLSGGARLEEILWIDHLLK
ncbi:hypothetical protein L7F22_050347 [Adiantum nelumboides]|nr:hypothetical protein [Adiantum nelumboides]